MGPLNACSMAIGVLECLRVLPAAGRKQCQHPLSWLLIGAVGGSQKVDSYPVTIAGGESADIEVNDAPPNGPGVSSHWQGTLQISADRYDTKTIGIQLYRK